MPKLYPDVVAIDRELLESIADNVKLSPEEKIARTKAAKLGTWYDGWRPYCITCSTMNRMSEQEYGFKCNSCNNIIGFNLHRLKESPLNNL